MNLSKENRVMLGCENFFKNHLAIIKNKKVGLITNQTGVNSELRNLIDLFHDNPAIDLVALYGPEHGVKGDVQAGQYIPFYRDDKYDLPVYSLYGQSVEFDSPEEKDSDELMRFVDTIDTGKYPEKQMIENVDVLVFDLQDIGTRVYTYIATMAYCMQVCAEMGIDFIVLDRPNPINGVNMEGPVLDYPAFSSFVGVYPIPIRHGMTMGELALLFNAKYLSKKADLTVIPMEGWKRSMWFDQTGLPWVFPSPNIPTLQTATVYPGQVFLEGTNISEGRGTTKPFEIFGAPWMDGQELAHRLNAFALPGVKFRESMFTPCYSKFKNQLCYGAQIHILDRHSYHPFITTLHIIQSVKQMYPGKFKFHPQYFDKIIGSSSVRQAIEEGKHVNELNQKFAAQVEEFASQRDSYFLYENTV
jgi:uncharacterized protein YbbC (DUF1343 family)